MKYKFKQIFCDSSDVLNNLYLEKIIDKHVKIKTSSPNILYKSKNKNILHLEKNIKGKKIKLLQKSIYPLTKEVFLSLNNTKYKKISLMAASQANYFHRLLRKVACLEKQDNKKTLIIKLETGSSELNEYVNTEWEEVLKGKNYVYKKYNVEHYGDKNLKIHYQSILDHININSLNINLFYFYKKFKSIFFSKNKENICLIFREDFLLREMSTYLFKKGVTLEFFKKPKISNKEFSNNKFNEIKKILHPIILKHSRKWVHPEYLKNIINFYFKKLKISLDQYEYYSFFFDDYLDSFKKKKILCATSYPGLPIYIALSHQARRKKIKLISTQHGINREINSFYSEGLTQLENNIADLLFVCNYEGKKISDKSPFAYGKTKVVGTPNQMSSRKKIKSLKSLLNKKIFYISTRTSSGNLNMLNGYQTDYERVMEEMNLVKNVFSKLKQKIYFKAYPYKDYYVDRDPVHQEIDKIKNIKLIYTSKDLHSYFDDISLIITSRATSTLSWCMLSNIPLIFIDHKKEFRLKNKVRNIFKEGLIFFDKNNKFYERDLLNYLCRPLNQIKIDWDNKKKKRQEIIQNYISSNHDEPAGKVAADYLLNNNYFKVVNKFK